MPDQNNNKHIRDVIFTEDSLKAFFRTVASKLTDLKNNLKEAIEYFEEQIQNLLNRLNQEIPKFPATNLENIINGPNENKTGSFVVYYDKLYEGNEYQEFFQIPIKGFNQNGSLVIENDIEAMRYTQSQVDYQYEDQNRKSTSGHFIHSLTMGEEENLNNIYIKNNYENNNNYELLTLDPIPITSENQEAAAQFFGSFNLYSYYRYRIKINITSQDLEVNTIYPKDKIKTLQLTLQEKWYTNDDNSYTNTSSSYTNINVNDNNFDSLKDLGIINPTYNFEILNYIDNIQEDEQYDSNIKYFLEVQDNSLVTQDNNSYTPITISDGSDTELDRISWSTAINEGAIYYKDNDNGEYKEVENKPVYNDNNKYVTISPSYTFSLYTPRDQSTFEEEAEGLYVKDTIDNSYKRFNYIPELEEDVVYVQYADECYKKLEGLTEDDLQKLRLDGNLFIKIKKGSSNNGKPHTIDDVFCYQEITEYTGNDFIFVRLPKKYNTFTLDTTFTYYTLQPFNEVTLKENETDEIEKPLSEFTREITVEEWNNLLGQYNLYYKNVDRNNNFSWIKVKANDSYNNNIIYYCYDGNCFQEIINRDNIESWQNSILNGALFIQNDDGSYTRVRKTKSFDSTINYYKFTSGIQTIQLCNNENDFNNAFKTENIELYKAIPSEVNDYIVLNKRNEDNTVSFQLYFADNYIKILPELSFEDRDQSKTYYQKNNNYSFSILNLDVENNEIIETKSLRKYFYSPNTWKNLKIYKEVPIYYKDNGIYRLLTEQEKENFETSSNPTFAIKKQTAGLTTLEDDPGAGIMPTTKLEGSITTLGGIAAQKSIKGFKVHGAVFNDYAEYRHTEQIEPGRCAIETGKGDLILSDKRLQLGGNIISDTYGFSIGETDYANTPIAVCGRVLVYPYESKETFMPGQAVCSGPNGTISRMTREEIKEWPDAIIGYVSEIPVYKYWGSDNIEVNGRIWIRIK